MVNRSLANVNSINGNFSGTVDVNRITFAGDTNTYIQNIGGSDWMGFTVGGLSYFSMSKAGVDKYAWFNSNQNQTIAFRVGYNGGTGIDMDGATGNVTFGSDIISSVGGSYKLYQLGAEGDTDTSYLELSNNGTNFQLYVKATGAGTEKNLAIGNAGTSISVNPVGQLLFRADGDYKLDILPSGSRFRDNLYPFTDGTLSVGTSSLRFGNVYSVDGNFSGSVTASNGVIVNSGRYVGLGFSNTKISFAASSCLLQVGTNTIFNAFTTQVQFYKTIVPNNTGSAWCGLTTKRWAGVHGVDGSFSGNLTSEVGGSYKLYNLGDESATDQEYLEFETTGTSYLIQPKKTGAGANRSLELRAPTGQAYLNLGFNGNASIGHNNTTNAYWGSNYFRFSVKVEPSATGTKDLGTDSLRWANVYSVDGSFSGTLDTEVGGSMRLFNLGSDGDTDTEYLETSWDSNAAVIATQATGAGTARAFDISVGSSSRLRGDSNYSYIYGSVGGYIYFGANQLRPQSGQSINIGTTTSRFNGVYATSGNFTVVDSNQIRGSSSININISNVTKMSVGTTSIGYWVNFIPVASGKTIGDAGHYWGNIYSEDGTFSDDVSIGGTATAAETFRVNRTINDASTVFQIFDANVTDTASDVNSNLLNLKVNGVQKFRVKKDGTCTAAAFSGDGSSLTNLPASSVDTGDDYTWTGENTFEEPTVFQETITGTAASFSGNLVSEGGGSLRQYGLGTDGDTDTEFLNIAWDTNTYYIEPKQTGSGANRNLYLRAGNRAAGVNIKTNAAELVAGTAAVVLTGSVLNTNRSFIPITNGTLSCGGTLNRWANVYSVEGDFSGDVVMAANVDFTGIPTSDPLVAGRLYNDSGTLKISSGGGAPPP